MKLPRWLSPVRTVDAETGWPQAVCREFVGRRASTLMLTIWIGWVVAMSAIVAARLLFGEDMEHDLARDILLSLVISLLFGSGCLLLAALLIVPARAWRARRGLRRFLAAPWCLKCRYPVPEAAREMEATICPECGEPIPPEIAALAVERAGVGSG